MDLRRKMTMHLTSTMTSPIKCPLLHGRPTAWKHTDRNRNRHRQRYRKIIYFDFMRFGDSRAVRNLLKHEVAFIIAYLDTM